jgi:hypothetical protein
VYPVKTRRVLNSGKDKWVYLGTAFDVGAQINVVLDTIPLWKDWDGSLVIFKEEG